MTLLQESESHTYVNISFILLRARSLRLVYTSCFVKFYSVVYWPCKQTGSRQEPSELACFFTYICTHPMSDCLQLFHLHISLKLDSQDRHISILVPLLVSVALRILKFPCDFFLLARKFIRESLLQRFAYFCVIIEYFEMYFIIK